MYQNTFGGQSPGGHVFDRLIVSIGSAVLTGGRLNLKMTVMNAQTIRDLLTEQPFKPFRLIMSSGQAYEVRHPEIAIVSRSTVLVGIPGPRGPDGPVEKVVTCALVHITRMEPIDGATTAT